MSRPGFLALSLLLAGLAGCHLLTGDPPAPTDLPTDLPTSTDPVYVVDGPDDIPGDSDPVWIRDARLTGDRLALTVQYGGGCADHDFALYGRPVFTRSTVPPVAFVYLRHDANGDTCEALLTDDLEFDLRPLKHAWRQRLDYRGPVHIGIATADADTARFVVETTL